MGSDSELNNRRNAASLGGATTAEIDASSPTVHSGHTAHSFTVPAGDAESVTGTATGAPTLQATKPENNGDDDVDDEAINQDCSERVLKFFMKDTPFSRAFLFIVLGICLGFAGAFFFSLNPNFSIFNVASVPCYFNFFALDFIGYGVLLALMHSCIVFAHKQPALYRSNLLHWITEFEEYLAAGIWVTFLLVIFSNVAVLDDSMSMPFIRSYLLGSGDSKNHVHLLCIALVVIVMAAVKRHFMHNLALQFNYSNYCDRVEESLFIEGILQNLNHAKNTYKFRKKWKTFLSDSSRPSASRRPVNATIQMSDFVEVKHSSNNQINLKEFAQAGQTVNQTTQTTTSPMTSTATSPTFIDIASSPIKPTSPTYTTTQSQAQGTSVPTASATSTTLSTSEKKRQFEEFSRLCNRTATQFDSLSGSDIRVEIHRESRRLASQLFKWLAHPQRGDITVAELEPYIDKPEDVNRFLSILKRSQKVPLHLQTASFSEGDLRRAIDSALLERHGLAKSMETVEMALGKIDGILNILILILVVSFVERLFFTKPGDSSALFGITTMFSASFLFKDVAKNTFESIIFLLIIHPYDIGDRVFIKLDTTDNKAGGDCTDNLLVVEMNLMSTVFERWDGVRIYVPNTVLSTKPIYNIRRSGPTTDLLKMSFAHSTRVDQLESLRLKLHQFLRQNRQDFTEFHRVNVDTLENCNKMNLTILIQHATNWQDFELQMARRTKILSFLKNSIEELGIHYMPPVQRVELHLEPRDASINRIA